MFSTLSGTRTRDFDPRSRATCIPDPWELPPHAIFNSRIPLEKNDLHRVPAPVQIPYLTPTSPQLHFPASQTLKPFDSSGMRVWHLRAGHETGHEHAWSHGTRFFACLVPALNPADREVFIGGTFFCIPCLPSIFLCLLHLGAATTAFGFWIPKFLIKLLLFCRRRYKNIVSSWTANRSSVWFVFIRVSCRFTKYRSTVCRVYFIISCIVFTLLLTVERPLVKPC